MSGEQTHEGQVPDQKHFTRLFPMDQVELSAHDSTPRETLLPIRCAPELTGPPCSAGLRASSAQFFCTGCIVHPSCMLGF